VESASDAGSLRRGGHWDGVVVVGWNVMEWWVGWDWLGWGSGMDGMHGWDGIASMGCRGGINTFSIICQTL
jgi:hypothetical protein